MYCKFVFLKREGKTGVFREKPPRVGKRLTSLTDMRYQNNNFLFKKKI